MDKAQVWITVAIIAVVTASIRFLPFVVFGGERRIPGIIEKLGRLLPCAVMGMLVVYCLKGVSFNAPRGFLPELIACLVVSVSYIWRRNTLLSIISGTIVYMVLVQLVF